MQLYVMHKYIFIITARGGDEFQYFSYNCIEIIAYEYIG